MYESALIYRTNLSALFSKEFLCAPWAFLRLESLCISFSSAVPGRVLVESEPRQEGFFFPSRVRRLIVPFLLEKFCIVGAPICAYSRSGIMQVYRQLVNLLCFSHFDLSSCVER